MDQDLAQAISQLANVLEKMGDRLQQMDERVQSMEITKQRQWYPSDQAYLLLGYDDYHKLWEAVDSGLLRVGKEVSDRRKPNSSRPVYYFHIQKCLERFQTVPERRGA